MNKQIVNFVQFNELYKILNEIRDILSFDPKNYKPTAGCIALKKKDFLIMLKLIKKKSKIRIN